MGQENDLGGEDFDMGAAVDSLSEGLGFEAEESPQPDDVMLDLESEGQAAETNTPADTPAETPEAPPGAEAIVEAPKTWRKEAAEQWAALPPTVQQEILKREQDIFRGLEGYKADATFGRSLRSAIDPYMPVLQQYGIDPAQQVSNLMQAHHTLALGTPEQKSAYLLQIAQEYGVDLSGLSPEGQPFVDPAVQGLQKQLQAVQSQLAAQHQAATQQRLSTITEEINAFASKPENEHFDAVANDIAAMLKSGAAKDLADAYEKAVWANPVTRAKLIAKQQAEAAAKSASESAQRANAAKRASSVVVRAKPSSASGTAPTGSMDDTMRETLAAITNRG